MAARALRLTALCALLLGGLSSALLAATGRGTTTTTATTAATTTAPAVTLPPASTSTTSTAADVLVFSGHGWGHGLGMSQWGADGYARHGWTYDRILAHYYTGTTLGKASVSTVRVLVLDGAKKTTLSSTAPWTLTDAAGQKAKLQPGDLQLTWKLAVDGLAAPPTPPLAFSSTQPLSVDGHPYRGRLVVSATGKKLQVVDVVGLEAYVKGVVPAEMPSTWPAEALKAQAVATRSYALANLQKSGPFDLYGDVRSQVYGGVLAETPAADAAVDATRGQVVLSGGKVADTLFFSTSGGRTATAADATGRAVPYLVSVPDPYDTLSPYHDWGPVLASAAPLQKLLKLPGPVQDVQPTLGSDGRVTQAVVIGPNGTRASLTGEQLRFDLGLRSTWFTVGQLALLAPKPIGYGGTASLAGIVRGVAGPLSLEERTGDGVWQPLQTAVAPGADGRFSVLVRPAATTQYRLVAGPLHAGLAKVGVAPLVTATVASGAASGSIRPALAGAAVQLQFSADGAAWSTVGSATTDGSGAFSVAATGTTAAGTYRVRVAPGHGLVPGFSKPVGCC